jgi:hypothetical protein
MAMASKREVTAPAEAQAARILFSRIRTSGHGKDPTNLAPNAVHLTSLDAEVNRVIA